MGTALNVIPLWSESAEFGDCYSRLAETVNWLQLLMHDQQVGLIDSTVLFSYLYSSLTVNFVEALSVQK